MKKEDARRIPAQAKEEKRKQAVMICNHGVTFAAIADSIGDHEHAVVRWIGTYERMETRH